MKVQQKIVLSLLLIIFIAKFSLAQNKSIAFFGAPTYRIDNASAGYTFNLELQFKLKNNHVFKLGYGQTYTSKERPEPLSGFTVLQRTPNNLGPLGANIGWSEDDWIGFSPDPHENVYFHHNLYLQYQMNFLKPFNFSIGPLLSFRQSSQIERYIYAEKYDFVVVVLENIAIPVYGYQKTLDLGAIIDIEYKLKSFGRLDLNARYRAQYYPLNNTLINDLGISFAINF